MAVVGALLASSLSSVPAHAEPAALTGTITAQDTGAPLQGCVNVYTTDSSWAGGTCADETGHWSLDGLESGTAFKVEVTAWDGVHLGQWATGAADFDTATEFLAPATVDVSLALGGTMTGRLTRADGSPAEGASITIVDPATQASVAWASAWGGDGSWSAVVPEGDYLVQFWDWPSVHWAYGASTPEGATVIHVEAGGTITVDDAFLANGTVAGTITADTTGDPVPGACASIFTAPIDPDVPGWAGESCADETGRYSVDISTPGTYTAFITDPTGTFASEYNGDVPTAVDAVSFEVTRGGTTTIDASLAKAASITGLAVDAKTGMPIDGACPALYLGHDGDYASGQVATCSEADGRWTVRGLGRGAYALHLNTNGGTSYMAGTWAFKADSQATADLISVQPGEDKTVRNVKLAPGGVLSGRITDQFGNPVKGAWVNAEGNFPGRAGPGEGPYTGYTDSDGRYTIIGLPAGSYTPLVYADYYNSDLAPEWSGDADTRSEATPITVRAGRSATFDAELGAAARITGRVVNADGSESTDYWVGFITTSDGTPIGDLDVHDGPFRSTTLPGGDFKIRLESPETGRTVWYDAATTELDATVVTLARGEQKEITIHLP